SASMGTTLTTLLASNVTGNLSIDNTTALNLGTLTVGGNLDIHASGAIASLGGTNLFITGASTFVSRLNGGAPITVGSAGSTFGGAVSMRSRNLADTANAAGTLTLDAASGLNVTQLVTTGDA